MNYSIKEIVFEWRYKRIISSLIKNDFIPNKYLFFKTVEELKLWNNRYYMNYYSRIRKENSENRLKLKDIKDDEYIVILKYCGWLYIDINRYLRYNEKKDEYILDEINILKKALLKHKLQEDIISIREVKNSFFDKLIKGEKPKKGLVFSDKGFVSSSLFLSYRKGIIMKKGLYENKTIMILKISKGIHGIYLEYINQNEEFELLLKDNLKFIIEKIYYIFSNRIIILKSIQNKYSLTT